MFVWNRGKAFNLIASIFFSAFLLVILFRFISLGEIGIAIKRVGLQFICVGFVFHVLANVFRAAVLWMFFQKEKLSYYEILKTHFVHNFFVHLIPASIGELSFPVLLKKKVPMEKSFSVLLISRLMLMTLTILLFLISIYKLFGFNLFLNFGYSGKILIYSCLAGILLISLVIKSQILSIISRLNMFNVFNEKFRYFIQQINENGKKLFNPLFLCAIVIFSLMSILSIAGYFISILEGLEMEYDLFQVLFVSSIGVATTILPVKSIGGFGTTEGAWAIGLVILGAGKEAAVEAGFVIHLFALLNVSILFFCGLDFSKKVQHESM